MSSMLAWIPAGASDYLKAKAVHDWLIFNCVYNSAAADQGYGNYDGGNRNPWNAYGAFVNKKCVCQGYALAFLAAMDTLGIKCDYVMNIGAEGTEGPTILIQKAKEGIEPDQGCRYDGCQRQIDQQ